MRRSRVTITVSTALLKKIDLFADGEKIRNRSHAIEYILNDYFKPTIKTGVILAGGQGTNGLFPIQGKPLLEYTVENCKTNGITRIIICTNKNIKTIRKHFGDGKKFGVEIYYSEEKTPLKTGGALLNIKKYIEKEAFLVINGDVLTNLSFNDLILFHHQEHTVATVALTSVHQPKSFGQLKLHGAKLVKFYQKKTQLESHLINAGIYVFEPTIFDYFPKSDKKFYLEDVIARLVSEKKANGFVFDEVWFDVGDAKDYEKAIKQFSPSS